MSPFNSQSWKQPTNSRTNTMTSIRGKISAPIPIQSTDDDEFPIREPGTGIATPLGIDDNDKQLRIVPPSVVAEEGNRGSASPTSVYAQESPPEIQVVAPASNRMSYESPQRQTTSLTRDYDFSSNADTPQPSLEKPQRKKSTFRSALSKLFGRKKNKNQANASKSKSGNTQHHSDPTALRGNPREKIMTQKRAASLPINEFNRALRSHSPLTDDVANQANQEHIVHAITVDPVKTRPRGATQPSRYFERSTTLPDWGLAPRPSSNRSRNPFHTDDVDAIGTAVTSGSHPNRRSRSLSHLRQKLAEEQNRPRRRSDEIRYWRMSYDPDALSPMSSENKENEQPDNTFEVYADQTQQSERQHEQERSQQAVQPAPQPFNFGPLGEMAGMKITQAANLETRVGRVEDRLHKIERTVSHIHHRTSGAGSMLQLQDPPKTRTTREGSPMGRPRTEESEMNLPLGGREARRSGLYQQTHNPQADTTYTPQNAKTYIYESRPSTTSTTAQSPHHAFSELSPPPSFRTTSSQLPVPSTSTSTSNPSLYSATHDDSKSQTAKSRPLSTSTTIRPLGSSPTRTSFPQTQSTNPRDSNIPLAPEGSSGALTAHHYSALLNLIAAERQARERLEETVLHLQQQLHAVLSSGLVSSPSNRGYRGSAVSKSRGFAAREYAQEKKSYGRGGAAGGEFDGRGLGLDGMPMGPTLPSHNHSQTHGIDRIEHILEASSSPPYSHSYNSAPPLHNTNDYSHGQNESESDGEDGYGNDDVFQTPNEDRAFGVLGTNDDDEDGNKENEHETDVCGEDKVMGNRGGGARTLSLSQMTLGRGGHAATNF